jgi:excisionase family DNA binding protein
VLTTTDVAKQLGISPSYVRKLLERGYLPKLKDGSGVYRFNPHNVAEVARKIGRAVRTDGATAAKIYGYFLTPGFRPTREAIARIVCETGEHPDLVHALWEKYKAGVGAAGSGSDAEAKEIDRLAREYDEQIAAMDEELVRKRRGVFIAGDSDDSNGKAPPSRKKK